VTVTASVALVNDKKVRVRDSSNVVIWLTPSGSDPSNTPTWHLPAQPQLVQRNKSFEPHVLVIPVGTEVKFPNRDPFFHNVFSLFEGKRFDLGLYEAGTTRNVLFDKPGISYIFCNIHAEMSAVVIALSTPYYAISDQRGQVKIPAVPPGRYTLRVWYETGLPDALNSMTREVTISDNTPTLGSLRLAISGAPQTHQNMYGRDYVPPSPGTAAYERR
jgi:hypothetical protein